MSGMSASITVNLTEDKINLHWGDLHDGHSRLAFHWFSFSGLDIWLTSPQIIELRDSLNERIALIAERIEAVPA